MAEPYELSNRFIEARGIRFHVSLDGTEGQPVLALVNPASSNLTCWEPVLSGLVKHFRVLRFDIRGTGKSGWGDDKDFTFPTYADDLAAIMEELSMEQAFVLGVAYGARTAAQMAIRHEARLSALGLFDVSLIPPVAQSGQRALGARARAMLAEAGETVPEMRKSWRFYEDRDAALKAHTAHEHEPDTSAMLGDLKIPVLIGCGEQDLNLGEARRIADLTPTSEFHAMAMTGHGSFYFRPQLFSDLVVAFAARHGLIATDTERP